MYNQASIKPQEAGSMFTFPLGSVTTEGLEITSDGFKNYAASDPKWLDARNNSSLAMKNPVFASQASIDRGEKLYLTYCEVCHAEDGQSNTRVGKLKGVPSIVLMLASGPSVTDGYLFNKIKFGGLAIEGMPAFGYATAPQERWDMVNYVQQKLIKGK